MKVRKLFTSKGDFGGYAFQYPGCTMMHLFDNRWTFNGDLEKPSFSPSLLARWPENNVCHFFVQEGRIRFLSDCTHELKGKTVELEKIDF